MFSDVLVSRALVRGRWSTGLKCLPTFFRKIKSCLQQQFFMLKFPLMNFFCLKQNPDEGPLELVVQEIGHLVISCSIIDFCNKLQRFTVRVREVHHGLVFGAQSFTYFFDERSPLRHKQIFFIWQIPSYKIFLKELLC